MLCWCAQYTSRTGCQRSASSPIESSRSNTTQAFLLGEYFSNPRPDVLLVFSNTHDQMKLSQHAANVDQFARLVDELVPASTRLVWASRHAEDDSKKPPGWLNKRYVQDDGRRLTRLEWLNESNRMLYAQLRQRFIDGRRPTIMFPDLLAMSQPALKDLNKEWRPHVRWLVPVCHVFHTTVALSRIGKCGIIFYIFRFGFCSVFGFWKKTRILFRMSLVRFGSKNAVRILFTNDVIAE